MSINLWLPFISTAIMFLFAALVIGRYLARRSGGLYLLVWGIGLLMFGLGSFGEAYSALGWNADVFRIWYAFGAILNAGWLGMGTLYLLARGKWRKVAHGVAVVLVLLSLAAVFMMWTTPLDASKFSTSVALSDQYRNIMPPGAPVRSMTPLFNIFGLVALVGGALYSSYLFWRKRVMGNRVVGNMLIAAGALAIASASTLTRLGLGTYLYLGELLA
ncbi:MAG: hypothetical protein LC737_10795, partial [Chloroflexi bacterium]|nr:hypothetical protein [Chloroflexota bacterium]